MSLEKKVEETLEKIKCVCCHKRYTESGDYKYPLKTKSIYHTKWHYKYEFMDIWICPECVRLDLKKYTRKLGKK